MRLALPARRLSLALALTLALATPAPAFDRYEFLPGDSVTAEVLRPGDADEFDLLLARGSKLTLSVNGLAPGNFVPSLGFLNENYASVIGTLGFIGTSKPGGRSVTILSTVPVMDSGRYRFLVQAGEVAPGIFSLGSYRCRNTVRPGLKFVLKGTGDDPMPVTSLQFGAYPGYQATVTLRSRGAEPVTLASITGPNGQELGVAPAKRRRWRFRKRASKQPGFEIEEFGDHRIEVNVPEGTRRWSATVTLKGRLPRGTARDVRESGLAEAPGVSLAIAFTPSIQITSESGGPNDFILSAFRATLPNDGGTLGLPSGTSIDPRARNPARPNCTRDAIGGGDPPTAYRLTCPNGLFTDVMNVVRNESGDVLSFEAPVVRSPLGTGSATLSGFTLNDDGLPTGWTEVRRFDRTGNEHTLVIRGIEYLPNGIVKEYAVDHTDAAGTTRTYYHAPFNFR